MNAPVLAMIAEGMGPSLSVQHPNRLWSLWDMQEIGVAGFIQLFNLVTGLTDVAQFADHIGQGHQLNDKVGLEGVQNWEKFKDLAEFLPERMRNAGMPTSAALLENIAEALNKDLPWREIVNRCRSFRDGSVAEMESKLFYLIDPSLQHYIKKSAVELYGQEVALRYPSILGDLREASRCIAFERWTASVFHCLRVLEKMLYSVYHSLGLTTPARKQERTWGAILGPIKKEIDARDALCNKAATHDPVWAAKSGFYAGIHSHLSSVKNAWRDPTMHVESGEYLRGQATDIHTHTISLIRHLAQHLDENGNWIA